MYLHLEKTTKKFCEQYQTKEKLERETTIQQTIYLICETANLE